MTRRAGQILCGGCKRNSCQCAAKSADKWLVRVYRGEDTNGKKSYESTVIRGTKKDAQRYLTSVLRNLDLGTHVEPSEMTLNEYLDEWAEATKGSVRERTLIDYLWLLKRYVRPVLGAVKLAQLNGPRIQKLYNDMQQRGYAPQTIRHVHKVLSLALKKALKWRRIGHNPAELADRPPQRRKEMRALSGEESRSFLAAAAGGKWRVLFEFALATGMRPSEYLGLKWDDIDWIAGAATVRRVLVLHNGRSYFSEPKTAKSRRTVPLPPSLTRALKLHKQRQAEERLARGSEYENQGMVFAGRDGQPLDEKNLAARHFKPLLQVAGLPASIRLYDLRHTCATLLLAAGENAKIVSERLGHASIVLTLDTYSHVLPGMQQSAVTKLESALYGS